MQERYLGDSHDFLKYALLRHLHRQLGARIGVNRYLTRPEHVDALTSNDGEKRHHMTAQGWRESDPELFDRITGLQRPEDRVLGNVSALGILPVGTAYYDAPLVHSSRDGWHGAALRDLVGAELVFLDPDNGFEVPSMTSRTASKYARYAEAADYYNAGKIVVGIQFARQCDPVERAIATRRKLMAIAGSNVALPVVRGRVAPNILFLCLAPARNAAKLNDALRSFVSRCARTELIG